MGPTTGERCEACPRPAGAGCPGLDRVALCRLVAAGRADYAELVRRWPGDPGPAEDPGLPGLARQASGFVATAAAVLGSGFEMAPEAEQQSRWSACRACPNLREADLRCGGDDGCGCHLPRKIPFAAASCPLGKW